MSRKEKQAAAEVRRSDMILRWVSELKQFMGLGLPFHSAADKLKQDAEKAMNKDPKTRQEVRDAWNHFGRILKEEAAKINAQHTENGR